MSYNTGKGTKEFQDFFTKPLDVRECLANIDLPDADVLTVLEPTVGCGNIALEILALNRKVTVFAYEIQKDYIEQYITQALKNGYSVHTEQDGCVVVSNH